MSHTASKGKNVYGVDLMIAYVNLFDPKAIKINLNTINYDIDMKGEG